MDALTSVTEVSCWCTVPDLCNGSLPAEIATRLEYWLNQSECSVRRVEVAGRNWNSGKVVRLGVEGCVLLDTGVLEGIDQTKMRAFFTVVGAGNDDRILIRCESNVSGFRMTVDDVDKPCDTCLHRNGTPQQNQAAFSVTKQNPILICRSCNIGYHMQCCTHLPGTRKLADPFYCFLCHEPARNLDGEEQQLWKQQPAENAGRFITKDDSSSAVQGKQCSSSAGSAGAAPNTHVDDADRQSLCQAASQPAVGHAGEQSDTLYQAEISPDNSTVHDPSRWGFMHTDDLQEASQAAIASAISVRCHTAFGCSVQRQDPDNLPVRCAEEDPLGFLFLLGITCVPPHMDRDSPRDHLLESGQQIFSDAILEGEPMPGSPVRLADWVLDAIEVEQQRPAASATYGQQHPLPDPVAMDSRPHHQTVTEPPSEPTATIQAKRQLQSAGESPLHDQSPCLPPIALIQSSARKVSFENTTPLHASPSKRRHHSPTSLQQLSPDQYARPSKMSRSSDDPSNPVNSEPLRSLSASHNSQEQGMHASPAVDDHGTSAPGVLPTALELLHHHQATPQSDQPVRTAGMQHPDQDAQQVDTHEGAGIATAGLPEKIIKEEKLIKEDKQPHDAPTQHYNCSPDIVAVDAQLQTGAQEKKRKIPSKKGALAPIPGRFLNSDSMFRGLSKQDSGPKQRSSELAAASAPGQFRRDSGSTAGM